jgi:hypothetical protein
MAQVDDPKIIDNYKTVTTNWMVDKPKTFKVISTSNEVKGTITINKNTLFTSNSNVEIGDLTTPPNSEYRYTLQLVAPTETQKVFMVKQFSLNNEFIMTEPVFLQEESIFGSMGSFFSRSGNNLDTKSTEPIAPDDTSEYPVHTEAPLISEIKAKPTANSSGFLSSFRSSASSLGSSVGNSFGFGSNKSNKSNNSIKIGGKTRRRGKTQKRKRSKKSRKTKSKK